MAREGVARGRARLRTVLAAIAAAGLAAPAWGASVVDVRVGRHADFTRVVFELDAAAGYQLELARPGGQPPSIVVVLDAEALPELRSGIPGLVESVQIEPRGRTSVARIRLRTDRPRIEEMILSSPPRIVVDVIEEKQAAAPPAPRSPAPRAEAPPAPAPATAPRAEAPPSPAPPSAESAPLPEPRRIDPQPVPAPSEEVAPSPPAPRPEQSPPPSETETASAPPTRSIRPPRAEPPASPPSGARTQPAPGPSRAAQPPGAAPEPARESPRPWEPSADEGWSTRQIAALVIGGIVTLALALRLRRTPDRTRPRQAPKPLTRPEPERAPEREPVVESSAMAPLVFEPEPVARPGEHEAAAAPAADPEPPPPAPEITRPPVPLPAEPGSEADRRVAELEARIEELVGFQERIERQILAHNEELRVQRAAIARTQRVVRGLMRPEDKLGDPEDGSGSGPSY